jgi:uncharacterized protein YbjT (DUF2867 family)
MRVLVTGASGRVGRHLVEELLRQGVAVRAAQRGASPHRAGWAAEAVRFSYTDERTWPAALDGVDSMFVLRPPQISNVKRDMLPALESARRSGVRRMVLLSLQGAERNRAVPHYALEKWLRASSLEWTFVRAGFFMQNLSTTHAQEIREHGQIVVPAGNGRTSFVDAQDVAAVAARALVQEGLVRQAVTPTGGGALTYAEVADLLSRELERPIRYTRPGPARFWRHTRALGTGRTEAAVMLALYSACRFNLAAGITDDVERVLGRPPVTFQEFAHTERKAWMPPTSP